MGSVLGMEMTQLNIRVGAEITVSDSKVAKTPAQG